MCDNQLTLTPFFFLFSMFHFESFVTDLQRHVLEVFHNSRKQNEDTFIQMRSGRDITNHEVSKSKNHLYRIQKHRRLGSVRIITNKILVPNFRVDY